MCISTAAAVTASEALLVRADELPTAKLEELYPALSAYKHAIDKIVELLDGIVLRSSGAATGARRVD
jgi:hypothetical protein